MAGGGWRKMREPALGGMCLNGSSEVIRRDSQKRFLPRGDGGVSCDTIHSATNTAFETMSKRRRGFPSETQVKRGEQVVHGDKLLEEKLGRNDLCPCGSGKRFRRCCLKKGLF